MLEDCWEDLVGNQSAAVNMSIAAGNLAEKLRKTIEGELDQVDMRTRSSQYQVCAIEARNR